MKVKVPERSADERKKDFDEVELGYTEDQAIEEASRCLLCKNPPCVKGCPVQVDIPGFIKLIKEKKHAEAAALIKKTNTLPGVCGRVCPQEVQCQKPCIRGIKDDPIQIGKLERFASDHAKDSIPEIKKTNTKVAIVGSGPAGLTCAGDLLKAGFNVTIYEALHEAGGVLIYGIPEFRLPNKVVEEEINQIKKLGAKIELNKLIGQTFTIEELQKEYDAVFIGTGAGLPYFMNIPGESLDNVYSANEFLVRVNLMRAHKFPEYDTPVKKVKHTIVVGGGNVAMDSARTALRLGSKVTIVYRRTENEMPARNEEIEHAKQEGIKFELLTNPTAIHGREKVEEVECIRMELGEPDKSGRRRPIPVKDSNFKIKADMIVMAIGQGSNPLIADSTPELDTGKWKNISVDEKTGKTNLKNVYAGGDIVSGASTVIEAMGHGKRAAADIIKRLS